MELHPELIADIIIIFVQLGLMTLPVMFLFDCLCFAEQNISSTLLVCNDVHDYATRKNHDLLHLLTTMSMLNIQKI